MSKTECSKFERALSNCSISGCQLDGIFDYGYFH